MRKFFSRFLTLLFVLALGTNVAWAQGLDALIGGLNPENPNTWFYVNLTAKPSNPHCGTNNPGTVWMVATTCEQTDKLDVNGNPIDLLDENGDPIPELDENGDPLCEGCYVHVKERKAHNPWLVTEPKPENPYDEENQNWDYRQWSEEYGFSDGLSDAKNGLTEKNYRSHYDDDGWTNAVKEGYDAAWDWWKSGHYLNATNPLGYATTVSLNGYALIYAPGMEDLDNFEISSYAYFYGKVRENDGWYFTGWSYTEGESDLGGVVGEADSTMFRVLPSATAGESNIRNEYVYATFKPVLVANYKVSGMMNVGTEAAEYGETTVVFDAAGERVSASDFTASVEGANFTATITDCTDKKVTVTVRFTNPGALAENVYRGDVKLASKSGCSELTAAVYARVGGASENDATLYDGKTPTATSGTLEAMITAANGTDKIVVLNHNYAAALNINATVTLDLNGYNLEDALTVSGGEVTIAYNKYGGRGTSASVTGGKLILNGAEFASLAISNGAAVEQNGALITGAVANNGTLIATEGHVEGGLSSAGALTINGGTYEGTTAITVTAGTATINKATVSGAEYGIRTTDGVAEITSKLVTVYGGTNAVAGNGGTITLNNGKYDAPETPLAGTIDLQAGYFKVDGAHLGIAVPEGKKVLNVLAGTEFAAGYRYFVGDDATSVGVCRIGTTAYARLEDALAYANNNTDKNVVIIMTNDYVLPAGYYTLPSNATLIVPMDNSQETGYEIVNRVSSNSASRVDYVQPYEFRRLTFAAGVNMDVHGTIELTGTQRAADDGYASMPHGPYGHLVMNESSHMTLQNGSLLRAWGYMTGKGETDARRGSKVREQFQMGDWKGGSKSFDMLDISKNPGRIFPITQYFIQNIEAPVKYHPGATLSTTASVSAAYGSMGITAMANDIIVVGVSGGDPAMFFMDQEADAENTWVRKWYNPETDVQTYDVNSGAHIGSMVLDLGKLGTDPLKMNSGMFVLPITNNMKIHLLSGLMDFTQTTALLAGAEVEVDKESTVTIYDNPDPDVYSGALYIYDADDWDYYAVGKGDAANSKYTKVVKYSASVDGQPTVRHENVKPGDATVNVHGTFATGGGAVYTTNGGANIFSTNVDAGSFVFTQAVPENSAIYQIKNNGNLPGTSKTAVSAKLKNGDNSYTETAGAGANQTFIYMDGEWKTSESVYSQLLYFDCYTTEADMTIYGGHIYDEDYVRQIAITEAPDNIAEYLAAKYIAANQASVDLDAQTYEWAKAHLNDDHSGDTPQNQYMFQLFGQLFPYVAPQKTAIREAGYDLGDAVQKIYIKPQEWLEIVGQAHVRLNLDYDIIEEYEAAYNTNPNQAVEDYLTYINDNLMNPYLTGVDGNADHTYSDATGAGRLFILMPNACQWWEVENVNNLYHCIHPQNDTYYYWSEADGEWKEKKYTITWKNWNGTIIPTANQDGDMQDNYEVTYGTMAEFLGTNPTRVADIDYTYDFTGWTPALGPVTSDVTYTATYTQKPRMYTIIFQNEGGVEIERHFLTHNEVPVCENVPTKVGHTLEWSPAISAVTGDATYTATWLENPPTEYEVTFYDYNGTTILQQGDVAVGATPEYTGTTPTGKGATSEFTYEFDHWSPALEEVSATSIKSYTAVYREVEKTYTISYFKEDGVTPNTTKASESLPYGATPTPPAVTKENPEIGHTYTLVWKTLDETGGIQTVMGNASYKPTYLDVLNKYTVTVKSNPSGACAISGAGLYDYNSSATIALSVNDGYTFTGWSDGQEGTNTSRTITITEDKELVANFTVADPDWTITWKSEDGENTLAEVDQKANTATIFTGAIPTKDATAEKTYTFYGWTTRDNEGHNIDTIKNGMTPKATANATYYAYFNEEARKYTVAWKNEAGTADIEVDYDQPYGAAIEYNSAAPTKQATAAAIYTFDGWSTSVGGDAVALPATVSGDAVFYAHFAVTPKTYTITWKRDDGSLIDNTEVAYGELPSHADPTKPATAQYSYSFTGWDRDFEPVTGLTSYTASFSATPNVYTITWVDGDGNTLETDEDMAYGATPSYDGETPTKTETATYTYTFNGTWSPMIFPVSGNTTYVAQFDAAPKPTDLEIGVNESEDLADEVVERANLVITSNGAASGQLLGAENLSITGDAIFRIEKNFTAQQWYAVAVPWTVALSGIRDNDGNAFAAGNMYILEFDATAYASADRQNGRTDYWHFMDQNGHDMQPGKLYMIWFKYAQTAVQFYKKAGAPLWTTSTSVELASGSEAMQSNWNGIANPALYHANLNTGATDVLKYNGDDSYIVGSTDDMIVGEPMFVQVTTAATVPAQVASPSAYPAPAYHRAPKAATDAQSRFVVELIGNGQLADRLIVQTAEEKANEYVIGKDLAKMGVSTKMAQMWMERYDTKLCKNTVEMYGEYVHYPLTISAPVAGEYTITVSQAVVTDNEYALYLTYNDEAIWNLSEADYTLNLNKGTDANYGLRISARKTPTGIDEAVVNAQGEIKKVFIHNNVFIIRGENVYSVDGQIVK